MLMHEILTSLKSEADKLDSDKLEKSTNWFKQLKTDTSDVDKLIHFPVDLSKLSDVVKSDVAKKTEYDELVKKVNAIQNTDTSNLVQKN